MLFLLVGVVIPEGSFGSFAKLKVDSPTDMRASLITSMALGSKNVQAKELRLE
jgi:hypothetical protein